jgi:caa(3)-type oxidase subunit IV
MSTPLLRPRPTIVWGVLVAATITSWAVGAEHGTGAAVIVLVLAIAMIKVRFVGLDFMELRNAPVVLRAMFEFYCVALFLVLAGMYLWM